MQHIVTYRPKLRFLQVQIWKDVDVKSLVKMLTVCKQLTGFEIHGKLDYDGLITKVVSESLCALMEEQGANCRFKIQDTAQVCHF